MSFFLTIMKGEYDPLLPWPYRQTTVLMLLALDGVSRDITQSFKPDEKSSSFQMPQTEMNVASGCPQFSPQRMLENPSYCKNDTISLKCRKQPEEVPKPPTHAPVKGAVCDRYKVDEDAVKEMLSMKKSLTPPPSTLCGGSMFPLFVRPSESTTDSGIFSAEEF